MKTLAVRYFNHNMQGKHNTDTTSTTTTITSNDNGGNNNNNKYSQD